MYMWIYPVLSIKFNFFPGKIHPSVVCAKLRRVDNVLVDLSGVVYKVTFFLAQDGAS